MSATRIDVEQRVTPLELFFDLVFVFALTQVSTLLLDDVTWAGLGRSLLVLTALWWAWASYAWLTNTVDADSGIVLAVLLVAIGAMFVAALAVPEAFGSHRLVFAIAFLIVLAAFVGLFALAVRGEPDLLSAVVRMARTNLAGGVLIVAAAFVPAGGRPALWAAALAVGFVGSAFAGGLRGWRVQPAHFAERHALVVIIAIGEVLAAIGFGARGTDLGAGVIVAVLLGLVVAASFWLAYFDFFAGGVQRLLTERRGEQQIALARDVYSYLHLPMVAGIVLFGFAMRTALEHVHADLHVLPALALCCGSALYLLSYVVLRWRVARTLGRGRPIASLALAGLSAAAIQVPAIWALVLVACVWVALHAYELVWWREARARRRAPAAEAGS